MPATKTSRIRLKLERFDELTGGPDATLDDRAEVVGSDRANIYRYRTGQQRPGMAFVGRCLERLEVPFDELFEYEAAS